MSGSLQTRVLSVLSESYPPLNGAPGWKRPPRFSPSERPISWYSKLLRQVGNEYLCNRIALACDDLPLEGNRVLLAAVIIADIAVRPNPSLVKSLVDLVRTWFRPGDGSGDQHRKKLAIVIAWMVFAHGDLL